MTSRPSRDAPGPRANPRRIREPAARIAEYSTFRPNPAGSNRGGKPAWPKKTKSLNPLAENFEKPAGGPTWWERILLGRVSTGQLAQFCRQFAAYLSAGVDFTKSLSSLERQFSGTALGPILGRIQLSIRRGSTLEEAMAREPQAFGPMFLSMIKVAEARGGVPETLKMLAHHYEARQRLLRTARSAMIYPVIVITVASVVVALISIFLLPQFAKTLKDIAGNKSLPLPSQVLMAFSGFVQYIGWWLIPAGHDQHAVSAHLPLQDAGGQGDHGSDGAGDACFRLALPQARHVPFRPDAFGLAQCRSRRRQLDRHDRRRVDDEPRSARRSDRPAPRSSPARS